MGRKKKKTQFLSAEFIETEIDETEDEGVEARPGSSRVNEGQEKVSRSSKKRPPKDELISPSKKKIKKEVIIPKDPDPIESESEAGYIPAKTCTICSRTFTRSSDLTRHTLVHSKEKPFKCQLCPRGFRQKSNLNHHIKKLHCDNEGKDGPQPFRCSICKKPQKTWQKLRFHLDMHHRGVNQYECFTCLNRYKYESDLYRHEKIHLDVKFECHLCPTPKSFTRKDTLDTHIFKFHNRQQFENMERELAKQREVDSEKEPELDIKPIINIRPVVNVNSKTTKKSRKEKEKPTFDEIKESIETETMSKYKCQYCEESFGKRKRLKKHIEKDHNDINENNK